MSEKTILFHAKDDLSDPGIWVGRTALALLHILTDNGLQMLVDLHEAKQK